MRPNKVIPVFTAILISSLAGTSAYCQPQSNEQFVMESVSKAVNDNVELSGISRILLSDDSTGINRPILFGIVQALSGKGILSVFGPTSDTTDAELSFKISGLDFHYAKGSSMGFLKKHRIKRELQGQIMITIKRSADNAALVMKSVEFSNNDDIEPEALNFVKSRDIVELAPQAPSSRWSKFLEPALVTISVGALVYLFFANR